MDEGWHVAEMILTVQVAEKMKLEAQTMASPPTSRTAVLYSYATQAPMAMAIPSSRVRFGGFEVDLRSGELHKQGIKIKLHDQPFQAMHPRLAWQCPLLPAGSPLRNPKFASSIA